MPNLPPYTEMFTAAEAKRRAKQYTSEAVRASLEEAYRYIANACSSGDYSVSYEPKAYSNYHAVKEFLEQMGFEVKYSHFRYNEDGINISWANAEDEVEE